MNVSFFLIGVYAFAILLKFTWIFINGIILAAITKAMFFCRRVNVTECVGRTLVI